MLGGELVAGAKEGPQLERLARPHLTAPAAPAQDRTDGVGGRAHGDVGRRQDLPAVDHRPPSLAGIAAEPVEASS